MTPTEDGRAALEMTINGKIVQAATGDTILGVAQKSGFKIPTLCHHAALMPYGACRMCLVEVSEGGRPPVVHASCTYPAANGLTINTDTERLQKVRKVMIELHLARCPEVEQIRTMAKGLGVEKSRFKPKNDDCTLCGLCVRICREKMGPAILSFVGRGSSRKVQPPYDAASEECQTCGACAFICPTGKIKLSLVSTREAKPIPSDYNMGLSSRGAAYIPYPQAVPNKAVIDKQHCVHLLKGGCQVCTAFCEAKAIDFSQKEERRTIDVGAVILSPGFDIYDSAENGEYGYRRFPNVISSLDYERILSASGPFMGHVQRLSDGQAPKKIAFIQCVGSRDEAHPWCSSVCCMYATKQAIMTKEHLPEAECSIFVMDIRAFGKGFEEYVERAKTKYGVRYIHTRPSSIRQDFASHRLFLQSSDNGRAWEEDGFDLVVLSAGLCPSAESKKLAETCGIELNRHSFAKGALDLPIVTSREGVFVAGAFEEPKDIPESVTQASGAAAMAMELLSCARGTQIKPQAFPEEKNVTDQEVRVGVFICHCGSNIAGFIDCAKVASYASRLKDVVFSTNLIYSCSPDGLKQIQERIDSENLNRVVVASCSPRTHEPLFQKTIREKGLNVYLFEMANIRDQCTWVHARMGDITEKKSMDLVRMAVARARTIEPLHGQTYVPRHGALVVGGGPAGMAAAASIAVQGYPVHLIEKSGRLGGNLHKVKSTVDGLTTADLLEKLEGEILRSGNVTVHFNSRVESSTGFVGNFRTKIVTEMDGVSTETEIEHGAAIIATGADEMKPEEYLYGKNARIMTQQELESRMDQDSGFPRSLDEVVMIQCVGSREPDRLVCCRVGCTEAVKNAIAIKRANPAARIAVLYRDIRTYGMREEYYTEARKMGILFFRYDRETKPSVVETNGKIEVRMKDLNSGLELTFTPDALVLTAAMLPSPDNHQVGMAFKVPVDLNGFFLEAHMKLRPVDFASEGMFLCGTCHSPKFIGEAITQAKAAAARAMTILSKDLMEVSGVVSRVDADKCAACLTCVRTCPYGVPRINAKGVAEIETAMCHGCGICAAECPAKAIDLMHYKDPQVLAKTQAFFKEENELTGAPK